MSFESLGLPAHFNEITKELGFNKPTPIQRKAIPSILAGKDVMGIAKTGSGKTASYVLPMLAMLKGKFPKPNRHVSALVLVPTRELAVQVQEVFHTFNKGMQEPVRSLAVYGGVSINPQMKAMMGVKILIATPGRLLELVETYAVNLINIDMLVIDEADKLLNMGFKEEVDKVLKLVNRKRQNLLFSATLNEEVENINQIILNKPEIINVLEPETNLDLITQTGYFVAEEKKGPLLRHLIESKDMQQVLVFVSSVLKADRIANKLFKNGINAKATHGKKAFGNRTNVLHDFKTGKLRVLVATDLLARGIDIDFLPYVINYELPRSPLDYIHRIGRTGRAEHKGEALTLVTPEDTHHFKVIQKKMGKWVTMIDSESLDF